MSFSKNILAQIRGDNGEAGARVRKNKARNEQVGVVRKPRRAVKPKMVEVKTRAKATKIVPVEEAGAV